MVFAAIEDTDFGFVVLQERSQKPCKDAAACKPTLDARSGVTLYSDDGNYSAPPGACVTT